MLAARVYGDAGPGPLFDHLTLRVDVDEAPWLVDVGFGRFVAAPFRLDVRDDQHDLAGVVRVRGDGRGRPGRPARRPARAEGGAAAAHPRRLRPRPAGTSRPRRDSHFTQSLTCSRPTGDHDRVTISDRLLITTVAGQRTETTLGSDAEVLAAYREHFGFTLDRLPTPPAS